MKFIHILFICCTTLAIMSCGNNNNSSVKEAARNSLSVSDSNEPAPIVNSNAPLTGDSAEPPQNADGVWHYVCVNACEGIGAGGAGTCSNCGGELTHNSEYHKNDKKPVANTTTPSVNFTPPVGGAAGAAGAVANTTFTPPTTAPEPPQNAKGVWHYTCSAGCAGGAGAAGSCNKCGGELTHNTAYHN